jgi:hypothetical protein
MARRMHRFNRYISNFKFFTICRHVEIETGFGGGPEYDGGIGFTRQLQVPADKIRMKMGFEDIFDDRIVVFRNLQIEI